METEQNTGRRSPGAFKLVKIEQWFKNGIPQLVNKQFYNNCPISDG